MPFVDPAQGANAILAVSMAVCRAGASASEGHLGVGVLQFPWSTFFLQSGPFFHRSLIMLDLISPFFMCTKRHHRKFMKIPFPYKSGNVRAFPRI